jgi:hypothetical protein
MIFSTWPDRFMIAGKPEEPVVVSRRSGCQPDPVGCRVDLAALGTPPWKVVLGGSQGRTRLGRRFERARQIQPASGHASALTGSDYQGLDHQVR